MTTHKFPGTTPEANATNRILYWNPGEPQSVSLAPYPDPNANVNNRYRNSGLACYTDIQNANFESRKLMVFITAMHLIVRDGMDPLKVHAVFLELAEYRDGCAYDMPNMPF